jgi:hypothetical protein
MGMRITLIIPAMLAATACSQAGAQRGDEAAASGSGNQRSYQVGEFDAVSLGASHTVVVNVGGAPSVRAEGASEALDRLEIRTNGRQLLIGSKKNGGNLLGSHSKVTVYVTTPRLEKAAIGGSGDMRIDRVEGTGFEGDIGGSGDMEIGNIRVERAKMSIAGSGSIRATGAAGQTKVSIAGSGDVNLEALETRSANVSIAGSGDAKLRVMETADISLVGSGDVTVSGTAKCNVRRMGSGQARCQQ